MRLSKITTKQGDSGKTLLGCQLVPKGHPAVELLGELDLLNILLGNINEHEEFQDVIFEISAAIYKQQDWDKADEETEWLEDMISSMNDSLEQLKEFIRPSGDIHTARAQARRCERLSWSYDSSKRYNVYLNRLSDYLFVLARIESSEEHQWSRS